MLIAQDEGNFYRIPADNRDLNYNKFFDEGRHELSTVQAYNSQNTNQLDVPEMKNMLAKLDFIKKVLAGEEPL